MNRTVAIVTIVAAILLLAPYLGLDFFGTRPEPAARAPEQAAQRIEASATMPKEKAHPKQTMVEDLLNPAVEGEAKHNKKLADIENLLDSNGQDK